MSYWNPLGCYQSSLGLDLLSRRLSSVILSSTKSLFGMQGGRYKYVQVSFWSFGTCTYQVLLLGIIPRYRYEAPREDVPAVADVQTFARTAHHPRNESSESLVMTVNDDSMTFGTSRLTLVWFPCGCTSTCIPIGLRPSRIGTSAGVHAAGAEVGSRGCPVPGLPLGQSEIFYRWLFDACKAMADIRHLR